jgi:formamidopyrimidine-DNA glycosylase
MPELPEVETLRRHLENHIVGYRIQRVKVFKKRIVRPEGATKLAKTIQGHQILGIRRRGKYLVLQLSTGSESFGVLIHLGMTGRLFRLNNEDATDQSPHLAVHLECDKGQICYVDARTFGRWSLDLSCVDRLGPEPLESQSFHPTYLQEMFQGRKAKLKDMLMNQACVAGLGNIYVCEALHAAGLHPAMPVGHITSVDLKRLCQCIRRTLKSALKIGEQSELNLQGAGAGDGFFYFGRSSQSDQKIQERFRVYDRESEPCRGCKSPIERIMISQRSTYFCPNCQKI